MPSRVFKSSALLKELSKPAHELNAIGICVKSLSDEPDILGELIEGRFRFRRNLFRL